MMHVVNCHLSGGAAPERRLRQVHDAIDQVRKWNDARERELARQRRGNRPSPRGIAEAERALREYVDAGMVVCGDFNSDGNTAVRKLLVEGAVGPEVSLFTQPPRDGCNVIFELWGGELC